jgi:hypothetical protein
MPINNDLQDKKFPMELHFGKKPSTTFIEHLSNINVRLIDCPTMGQLERYIPEFALATWEANPRSPVYYSPNERREAVLKMFKGEVLPTAKETVGLTFLISNIDLVDVTHLIRHRAMSFSAHCTGDRDQRFDACLVKPSMLSKVNEEFLTRFIAIVEDAKQLYADMVDSKNVSILDARTILPRAMTNHYYARVNINEAAAKQLPPLKHVIDFNKPDMWYVKTAQTDHSSNLYMPEKPRNDIFDHKEQWFIYNKQRSEMPGGIVFKELFENLISELHSIEDY